MDHMAPTGAFALWALSQLILMNDLPGSGFASVDFMGEQLLSRSFEPWSMLAGSAITIDLESTGN